MINHGTLLGVTGGIYLANKRQANALHTSPLSGCDADQFVRSHRSSLSDLAEHGVENIYAITENVQRYVHKYGERAKRAAALAASVRSKDL